MRVDHLCVTKALDVFYGQTPGGKHKHRRRLAMAQALTALGLDELLIEIERLRRSLEGAEKYDRIALGPSAPFQGDVP
jgi:ABC-type thiamine transport system ATPase subunit